MIKIEIKPTVHQSSCVFAKKNIATEKKFQNRQYSCELTILISEKSPEAIKKKYFEKFHTVHHLPGNFMMNLSLESNFKNIKN